MPVVSATIASTSATMRVRNAVYSCACAVFTTVASARLASAFVALDEGVSRMVVDRLEILRFDHVRGDALVQIEQRRHVAHHVLDEFRIVVGALGHEFLVRALEQPVQLARGLLLDEVEHLLDPDEVRGLGGDRDMRALVVRPVIRDFLRAGAEPGHRYQHLHGEALPLLGDLADESDLVVHQAAYARYRRLLLDEVGKAHLDAALLRLEQLYHLLQHGLEALDRELALLRAQDLDEARHVRAFELVRQAHVHVEAGDGVLDAARALHDAHRMADRLDADLVDRQLARVGRGLDIGNVVQIFRLHDAIISPSKLLGNYALNRFLDAGGVQPYRRQEFCGVAVVDEAVGQPQQQRAGLRIRKDLQHRAARSAHDLVLFHGDDQLVRRGQSLHQLRVEGLDEAHVGDRGIELFGGLERRLEHRAESENGDSLALSPDFALSP